jgi:large subunit ribosomal protein L30
MARKLKIRRVRSVSGRQADQRATVDALGLRRLQQTVEHVDTPQIRGMIFKVRHLVEVEEGK